MSTQNLERTRNLGQGITYLFGFLGALFLQPGLAQNVTLDGTLGPPLELTGPVYEIEQDVGTIIGSNLFHSFEKLNLDNGEVANFESDFSIRNIFSRVTGGERSSIDGTLSTTSDAVNLFLINPNGTLFGSNASLAIGSATRGSFITTTVDGLIWPEGDRFDAVTPVKSQELLNLKGDPSGFIASQRAIPTIELEGNIFRVASGQSLLLLGGEIIATNSILFVDFPVGGRVEVAGITQAGIVPLTIQGNDLSLQLPEGLGRANIRLMNSIFDTSAEDGGNLSIYGNDIEIADDSSLLAGLGPSLGFPGAQAGELTLDAEGTVLVKGSGSSLVNEAGFRGGKGNAGNINIFATEVQVIDGAVIGTNTFGEGDAGDIRISATQRVLFQEGSFASSGVAVGGIGNGGDVIIETQVLEVTDVAQLLAVSFGEGDAGDVRISATQRALFDGITTDGQFSSLAASSIDPGGVGQGGNTIIETPILEITGGAQLSANTGGEGDAGNVQIVSTERVLVQGERSAIFSSVELEGKGQGGNIIIQAPVLEVTDGAQLTAATAGQGDAGNIKISTTERTLFTGEMVSAASSVVEGGIGTGGNVEIETPVLEVTDGAQLIAVTRGDGNAGNVQISARDRVRLDGSSLINGRSSGILTDNGTVNTDAQGTGAGGDILLSAPQLSLSNGALIVAQTVNDEPGGDITLNLDTLELLSGSQVLTTANSNGVAGDISIMAKDRIQISGTDPNFSERLAEFGTNVALTSEFSTLSVRSNSSGPAGNIILNTPNFILDNRAQVIAESSSGTGGSIFIGTKPNTPKFANLPTISPDVTLLRKNSLISATTGDSQNPGNGGNINITGAFLIGFPRENSDLIANAFSGTGGQINITANNLFNFEPVSRQTEAQLRQNTTNDISASSQLGNSGAIILDTINVNPADSLAELPTDLVDASSLVTQGLCRIGNKSEFLVTGRGGLPTSPTDTLSSTHAWEDWAISEFEGRSSDTDQALSSKTTSPPTIQSPQTVRPPQIHHLVEAKHWGKTPSGRIILYAAPSETIQAKSPHCRQVQQQLQSSNPSAVAGMSQQ